MLLGRFLEVSVPAPDIPASLEFYESLGFVQASTGEAYTHPYAVVTDGHLFIGLHRREQDGPTLTWVRPDVARHAPEFEALGIELAAARFDTAALNELGFSDPAGQRVTVLEARTFSPPDLPPGHASQLGYFEEFGVPTRAIDACREFWDRLGLVAFDPVEEPFGKVVVAGRDLNLGLYDLDLRRPVLTFSAPAMLERIASLRERGFAFAPRLPRGLDASRAAILRAPEGTELLLLDETP